jgi:hypothetical protein
MCGCGECPVRRTATGPLSWWSGSAVRTPTGSGSGMGRVVVATQAAEGMVVIDRWVPADRLRLVDVDEPAAGGR